LKQVLFFDAAGAVLKIGLPKSVKRSVCYGSGQGFWH
jgi:hypothetical protein